MADQESPILCPHCAAGYAWRYSAGNKRVTCKCGAVFRVPLNSFAACELVSKPGETLPASPDADLAIQEDPVEPVGYLKEVNLDPNPDEPLLTENESSAPKPPAPAPATPNAKPRRPQIRPFAETVNTSYLEPDKTTAPITPKPTPRPIAALTEKPVDTKSENTASARDALLPPTQLTLLCPHCKGELPGNVAADICPLCNSAIAPPRDKNFEANVQKTLDDPIMASLRKRGMEQVVQTVAREAAEREALNKKYAFERKIYDVWLPITAAASSVALILIITGVSLRQYSPLLLLTHHFVWLFLIMLPATLAAMWIGDRTLDADFHLDRILFTKVAGILLLPYAVGLLVVPHSFDMKNLLAYACFLVVNIGVYTITIGTVYRLSLSQAGIMTGVYGILTVIFSSTAANQLIKLIVWLVKSIFSFI